MSLFESQIKKEVQLCSCRKQLIWCITNCLERFCWFLCLFFPLSFIPYAYKLVAEFLKNKQASKELLNTNKPVSFWRSVEIWKEPEQVWDKCFKVVFSFRELWLLFKFFSRSSQALFFDACFSLFSSGGTKFRVGFVSVVCFLFCFGLV